MPEVLHPLPPCQAIQGHEQCPIDHRIRDEELEAVTEASPMGCLVRLIAGYDPDARTFSRTRYRYQILNGLDGLGWADASKSRAGDVLNQIAIQLPDVAEFAWGSDAADRLRDRDRARSIVAQFDGRDTQDPSLDWLLAGWHAIAGRGDVGNVYATWWYDHYVRPVIEWMQASGLDQYRTLAAGVRLKNSSNTWFNRLQDQVAANGESEGVSRALEEYSADKGPERAQRINNWSCFAGEINGYWPEPAQLSWSSDPTPTRPDELAPLGGGRSGQSAPPVTAIPGQGISGLARKANSIVRQHPWVTAGLLAAGGAVAVFLLWPKKKRTRRGRRR